MEVNNSKTMSSSVEAISLSVSLSTSLSLCLCLSISSSGRSMDLCYRFCVWVLVHVVCGVDKYTYIYKDFPFGVACIIGDRGITQGIRRVLQPRLVSTNHN